MRFRKSFKILKGLRINLSKSGVSTTIGKKGLSLNIGKKGSYLNTSIPNTGLYSRTKILGNSENKENYTEKEISNNINDDNITNINTYDKNIKKKDKEKVIRLSVLSATCLPFGLHKFYLGLYKQGIIYILFCWTLIPQIISLIEFFLFIKMKEEDFDKKYNKAYLYFLAVEERKAKKESIFKELEHLESISSEIDNSLDKNEKCFIKDNYTLWYEYRKIKGNDSLELINKGFFYLTNKKIIFISNTEIKKIALKDIVEVICNDDIELANLLKIIKLKGKNIILSFSELENMYKTYFFIIGYKNNLMELNKKEDTEAT